MNEVKTFRYSKKDLCIVLKMSRDTFARKMKDLQPEIEQLFPHYKKTHKLVSAKIFHWICDQIGPEKDERIEIIRNNFSLDRSNPFFNAPNPNK